MPRAVSDHGPKDFGSRCPGLSESEISLSMDFLAKSWLARKASLELRDASDGPEKKQCGVETHQGRFYAVNKCLAFGRSANHFLHFGLLGAARVFAGLLGSLLLARRALCLLAFFLAQCFRICHCGCSPSVGMCCFIEMRSDVFCYVASVPPGTLGVNRKMFHCPSTG